MVVLLLAVAMSLIVWTQKALLRSCVRGRALLLSLPAFWLSAVMLFHFNLACGLLFLLLYLRQGDGEYAVVHVGSNLFLIDIVGRIRVCSYFE